MKTQTEHAQCAAAIRRDLKAAYPTITFSVKSRSFAGGNAVDIAWTDGPTAEQIRKLAKPYQYGHFDGMIDLYEYSNTRDDIPQAKYVQTRRTISRLAYLAAVEHVNRYWGYELVAHPEYNSVTNESDGPRGNNSGWKSQDVSRFYSSLSLLCPACQAATLPGDVYCPACGVKLATDAT